MNQVFVLNPDKQPLNSIHPAQARLLLDQKQAAVFKMYPFTIILKDAVKASPKPLRLKVDPGSRKTGLVLVEEENKRVVFAAEIEHRGYYIKQRLDSRRVVRHSRRSRKTRHRQPRFLNRKKEKGWIAPSLMSRVHNIETWVKRFSRLSPVKFISLELVKFDMQLMENPEISGVEYQQGELQGYEVREYLLEKWGRNCVYCGIADIPLEVEHIIPRRRNGTNRVSNLTISCHECNQEKGAKTAAEFGHSEIQAKAKLPLRDAAAVNSTRWELHRRLKDFGLPVETGGGGRTKFNRVKQGYNKSHWIDAACVGESGEKTHLDCGMIPLNIKATGHGSRQSCSMDRFGFPRTSPKGRQMVHGFKTGDLVKATVLKGKKQGLYNGRVAIRAIGYFKVGNIDGISWKCCEAVHLSDGYSYQ